MTVPGGKSEGHKNKPPSPRLQGNDRMKRIIAMSKNIDKAGNIEDIMRDFANLNTLKFKRENTASQEHYMDYYDYATDDRENDPQDNIDNLWAIE